MAKYIDADKLIAEIERQYAEYRAKDDLTYYEGMADALDLFEQYIDSLQQEQPEVDLEKESLKYFIEIRVKDDETPILCDFKFKVNFATIARHFFELGLNARKEEQL